ncbi:5-dehydro-4-deoxy-D-glucuronate isomerase [Thalassotalea profundi]|uniref:4-deoxy-L-threo-5-hexosulose-uronate ketol-isomerase n=1 Tax=Thalassotalea profundi TaxID=2036687 RepID=A0ABQ3ITG5_9GAMM|nr:5-dehydro-4-deoxy-D-glucuronate isomerase [Thalassotalea profundi]GHE91292.1 4-deoxy-L-threo-5-hexosulose-uronate ketol-isomerase 2 [Thalassotalea profundi]
MTTKYTVQHNVHPQDFKSYDTQTIRERFLADGLMKNDEINFLYSYIDRFVIGGAVPSSNTLTLESLDAFKSEYFLERRELGVINVGGTGTITVDGVTYFLDYKDALYIGAGSKEVTFSSNDKSKPARFYLNSATAHKAFPTKLVTMADADSVEMGSNETCNERRINKLIVNGVVDTCQLQMGLTEFKAGSVWNTMPAHTHSRRNEAYFYFEVPDSQAVCHFMGEPQETRHIWIHNEQAIVSPSWSIHSGAGTSSYAFIWGMAGENLDYGDMDFVQPNEIL